MEGAFLLTAIEPDARPVVDQGSRLDFHRVTVDPVIEVGGNADPVTVTSCGPNPVTIGSLRVWLDRGHAHGGLS